MMDKLSPFDITHGLVDAITIWSDYLKGERTFKEWGVYGAYQFLSSIGFDIPQQPIGTEDLGRLWVLANAAENAIGKPLTIKDISKLQTKMKATTDALSPYFEANCGIQLDASAPSTDRIEKTCASVDVAVQVFQSLYDSAPKPDFSTFNTTQAVAGGNDYSDIPDVLDDTYLSADEYDIVGEDIIADYWQPPAPDHFDTEFGAVP